MSKNDKEWRALTGINYLDADGNEKRVEAGDKITDMPQNAVRHEKAAKNIEEWEPRKTENVRDDEDADVEVAGVQSRHEGGDVVIKEARENR
jgi:hypothetical protein